MKKCCIVTLIGGADNYGAELQNYAVQQLLIKLGYDVDTYFERTRLEESQVAFKCVIRDMVKKIVGKSYGKYLKRRKRFTYFRKKYISMSSFHKRDLNQINNKYDYFIVGSDQVWNPFYDSFDDTMLLKFADNHKKIALCASIGVSNIPEEKMVKFKKNLPLFKAISVREGRAKEVLNAVYPREIKVLCDPTILISKNNWEDIAINPGLSGQKYIFTYFLGELSKSRREKIQSIAKNRGYKIIDGSPYIRSRIDSKNPRYYDIGPAEFIWLVFHADLVCTDSFHGVVFSCIGGKKMMIFQRNDTLKMESRISNLITDIEGKMWEFEQINSIDEEKFVSYRKSKLDGTVKFLLENMTYQE